MNSESDKVFFYVNGVPRLMLAAAIAEKFYPDHCRYLILLDQFGYNYGEMLEQVEYLFEDIFTLTVSTKKYSHWDQCINCYFPRFGKLRDFLKPKADMVLFGLRSPAQKFLMKESIKLENTIYVYAESLSVDRYLYPKKDKSFVIGALRKLLPYAFDYQHDYKYFYVLNTEVYSDSPQRNKLKTMYNFYETDLYSRLSDHFTADLDMAPLQQYPCVFFGQPLSDFDKFISKEAEEAILKKIIGDRAALVLPHPNEIVGVGNKYECLPNAHIVDLAIPNDFLLLKLKPKTTITYSSTIGVSYAIQNPNSMNYFFPIYAYQYDVLKKYQQYIPNISVSDEYLIFDSPY